MTGDQEVLGEGGIRFVGVVNRAPELGRLLDIRKPNLFGADPEALDRSRLPSSLIEFRRLSQIGRRGLRGKKRPAGRPTTAGVFDPALSDCL